ncbi:hypothetical protein FOZ63_026235 [Perkinsus olseni]|uniref:Uncharacterized protein n=1 Tax=Perkinsus olseni TaxID=32597 RepID=A0A7J6UNQ4_PEROL|nr:hypothetical protein FOZ63_026235 [Perkinsus olseni]
MGGGVKRLIVAWLFLGFGQALRDDRQEGSGIELDLGGGSSLLQFVNFKALGGAAVSFMPPQFRGMAGGALNLLEAEALRKKGVVPLMGGGQDYHWVCVCTEEEEKKPENKRRCPAAQPTTPTKEKGTPLGCMPRSSLNR